MIYRDPKCVFVAESLGMAEVIVVFLADNNIPAQVMNPATLGGLVGLTSLSRTGVSANGIEVWVDEVASAERARELLAQREAILKAKAVEKAARTGTIHVPCDECGKVSSFPAAEAGTVQDCTHCGEYMDIPELENEPYEPNAFKKAEPDME